LSNILTSAQSALSAGLRIWRRRKVLQKI